MPAQTHLYNSYSKGRATEFASRENLLNWRHCIGQCKQPETHTQFNRVRKYAHGMMLYVLACRVQCGLGGAVAGHIPLCLGVGANEMPLKSRRHAN